MSEAMTGVAAQQDLVSLTIDGQTVQVPKGTNLVDAARMANIEIPHYCYHPHLSIAGNCRMCQVQINKNPKLAIGCNTVVQEGMEVNTHSSSQDVADAQAATLEFILINHPLDCTVCDQAGHCKLQDYHYEYNARPSRFLEDKVHKPKAKVLGPTVILDAERCIMCTRCVRFCDEVTETSELGMVNRGDRAEITVNEHRPLDNPLSGTVVDLCPVGALTHREWRFNTRIWFTKQTDTICPGCSTGCNTKVATRDGQIVQVKGRLNPSVNKEWMCDEGRYGFHRFVPEVRINRPMVLGEEVSLNEAIKSAALMGSTNSSESTLVIFAPDLTLEDYIVAKQLLDLSVKTYTAVIAYEERSLTAVEAKLISPDYAPNFRGAEYVGLVGGDLNSSYLAELRKLTTGQYRHLIVVGDRAILPRHVSSELLAAISSVPHSVGILCDRESPVVGRVRIVIPGRVILEKSGLLINRQGRLQYSQQVLDFPAGTEPEWRVFAQWAEFAGKGAGVILDGSLRKSSSDRDATRALLRSQPELSGLKLSTIKGQGVPLR
jgi:NADH-quinone oxidoreductase subunit G